MADDEIVQLNAAIDAYAEQALGAHSEGGEISRQRALALDAYQGKIIDAAPEGRSEVQDWSVFETVQWILPSLTRIFAGGDDIVEFDPIGPDDEDQAKQESEYLNYIVTQKNNWFLTCLTWFQDALITKNAYCMVFMDEKLDTEIESYGNLSEEQVTLLLEDDIEIVGQEQFDDPDDEGALIDPFTGQPVQDEITQMGALSVYEELGQEPIVQKRHLFNIKTRRTKARKVLKFQVLPPERCRVAEDTPDFTLEDCNYFEYEERETISTLRKMGFDVADDIGSDDFDDSEEDESRDEMLEHDMDVDSPDASMRQVKVRNIWIRFDSDGDGIAELQQILRVGKEILLQRPASRIPVASIVPFINTHRHMGISVADLVFDIQRIKTSMLRGGIDSLNLAVSPEHAVSNKVNIDDMLTVRPGGLKRIDTDMPDVGGHIVPVVRQNTFPDAQQGMQFMEAVTESRVGVNRQFQGIDEGLSNDHNRIGQLSSMAAQRVEQIARIFGNGVERLFSLAHELIIKSGHSMETVKLRGNWVNVDPTTWRTGRDMRVVAPFAAGNRDSLLQRLMIIAGFHEKALAGGLPIVDATDAYELALEISSAADVPGHKFFTDPTTVPPKEPPPDHTMIALEIENKKADNEAADEARRSEIEQTKLQLQAELDKYKADLAAEVDIALAQLQATGKIDVERVKANLRDAPILESNEGIRNAQSAIKSLSDEVSGPVKQALQKLDKAINDMNKPRKVRLPSGKEVTIDRNGVVK